MNKCKLNGELVIITGGNGLLGKQYAQAILEIGGMPIRLDLEPYFCKEELGYYHKCDITNEEEITKTLLSIKKAFKEPIYGLINNAAIDTKFEKSSQNTSKTRLEAFPLHVWDKEVAVGLTGAFLCTKVFGSEMIQNKKGVIINVSSVLGLIAPNQNLYKNFDLPEEQQIVKPVTYSVIKHGIIGLTRYTATYWANKGIRCNAIAPGGMYNNHDPLFVHKLSNFIPLQRMAEKDEYNATIQYLLTDASSFVNGAVIVMDGGQSIW